MRLFVPPIEPAALAGHDPSAPVVTLDGVTMGTTWRVLYAGRASAGDVHRAIVARLDGLIAQLSHWEPDSALCRFNRAAAGTWMTLPDDLAHVVDAALRIAQATGGAFDPAIGALVDLWGFGPPGPMPPPDDTAIAAARTRSGFHRLRWNPDARQLHQPGGVALDLSGIAKGHAVDAIADLLAASGIRHCLVEIGGELVGRGMRPDGDPWWVDLETPPGVALPPIRLALHQQAVATSGTYRRGDYNLDPRTGRPPRHGVVSVSVVAGSAMLADALASAASVMLPDADPCTSRDLGLRVLMRREGAIRETINQPLAHWRCNDDAAAQMV